MVHMRGHGVAAMLAPVRSNRSLIVWVALYGLLPHRSSLLGVLYGSYSPQSAVCSVAPCASCEFIQQRPGLLQVGSVKAFGEPAVDLCTQLAGCGTLALVLPQATRADL